MPSASGRKKLAQDLPVKRGPGSRSPASDGLGKIKRNDNVGRRKKNDQTKEPRRLAKIERQPTGRKGLKPILAPVQYVEPMKALGVTQISGGNWLLEIKYDGYRALGIKRGSEAELWSRNEKSLTGSYPEIAAALGKLRCKDAIIDGEVVALDPDGRPTFQLLQGRDTGEERPPIYYYVFDLLHLDGRSYLPEPIEKRKEALGKLLKGAPDAVRLSLVFEQPPDVLLEAVRKQGLEGIIGKLRGSLYEPGRRSGAWVKKRISVDQEFVVGGYTPPQGGRRHFGALLVGFYDGESLLYAGKVGTGFNAKLLSSLHAHFGKIKTDHCPFANLPTKRPRFGQGMTASGMREVTWLNPEIVAQIKFSEWTRDAMLRQPVFLGLREDKRAREVVREDPSSGSK